MTTGNPLSPSPAGDITAAARRGQSPLSRDMLAGILQRSIGRPGAALPDRFDAKRLIERAIEIDVDEPGSPLTEGQWDFGLDMLARADVPAEGTGLAVRQARIIVALTKALAELEAEEKRIAA
jgi:hypothetical protein